MLQEEREKRLGPGGLDPIEVYESLPQVSAVNSQHWARFLLVTGHF